jgi:hypothetical protein
MKSYSEIDRGMNYTGTGSMPNPEPVDRGMKYTPRDGMLVPGLSVDRGMHVLP